MSVSARIGSRLTSSRPAKSRSTDLEVDSFCSAAFVRSCFASLLSGGQRDLTRSLTRLRATVNTVVTREDGASCTRSEGSRKWKMYCSTIERWMVSRLGYFYDDYTAFVLTFLATNMINGGIETSIYISARINQCPLR